MERLKDLFYQYYANDSKDYMKLGVMPEVKEADEQLKEWIKYFDKDDYLEIESIVTTIATTNEMQGWVYGYMFAMQTLAACGIKVGGVA